MQYHGPAWLSPPAAGWAAARRTARRPARRLASAGLSSRCRPSMRLGGCCSDGDEVQRGFHALFAAPQQLPAGRVRVQQPRGRAGRPSAEPCTTWHDMADVCNMQLISMWHG